MLRSTERTADVERFVGKYADLDLETGVENVGERMDRDLGETDVRGR